MKIIYLFILIFLMSGCSNNALKQNYTTSETSNDGYEELDDFGNAIKSEDFNFPVPSDLGKVINYSKTKLNTIIADKQVMINYYEQLENNNWKQIRAKTSKSPISMYFNGKDGLVIKDSEEQNSGYWNVEIDYYEGKENSSYQGEYDDIIETFFAEDTIYAISEYDISDATTEMGLRGFYVYTDKIEPVKLIIDKYKEISLINFEQFLISDIDSDNENEFITRLGYGSGRYIITLSVWKYNDNDKKLELAYRTQYEQVGYLDMFIKKNDDKVEVIAGHWENGNIVLDDSYGNLGIKDGKLLPEKQDIPFKLLENLS